MLAKARNCKVADVIKKMYYEFYTETLRDSENTKSFVDSSSSIMHNIISVNYVICLLLFIFNGMEDYQLRNMGFICLLDLGLEFLGLIPKWRRRQFLLLDCFIRQIYSQQELWY